MTHQIRVTQLFDCADVGLSFVNEARRLRKPWRIIQGPGHAGGPKQPITGFGWSSWLRFPGPTCGTSTWVDGQSGREAYFPAPTP